MESEPNGTEDAASQEVAAPPTQPESSGEVSDLKQVPPCKESPDDLTQDAAAEQQKNGPSVEIGAQSDSGNGAPPTNESEQATPTPTSEAQQTPSANGAEQAPVTTTSETEQNHVPTTGETSVENSEETPAAAVANNTDVVQATEQPGEQAPTTAADPAGEVTQATGKPAQQESEPKKPDAAAGKVGAVPTKAKAKGGADQKAKKPTQQKDAVKSADESGKKPTPKRTQVSSRLFAPTASSLRKHSDKIELESHAKPAREISKDKPTTRGARPASATPSRTQKTTTPTARPATAPPAERKAPSSPRRGAQVEKKKPSGYGSMGPPPQRKTSPPKPRSSATSSAAPRETKTGYGSFGPPPQRRPAAQKPRSSAATPRTPREPTGKRPASAPATTPRTGPRTSPRKTTTSSTRPGSTATTTRRTVTTSTAPARPSSTTTRRTVASSTASPTRASSAGTTSRTVTTRTTRVIKDGAPVTSSTTTTVQKGGARPTSRTTTQARQTSGAARPASGTTTRTVTKTVHKSAGSPKKSPGNISTTPRPDTLNLTPKETVKSPLASPTHSPAMRNTIDHHEVGRADGVMRKLNEFRATKQFTDLILCVKKKEIYCHRMVMAACSAYFRETLANTFSAKTDIIDIRGVEGSILEVIVDYAYSATVSVPKRTVSSILEAAELFQFESLVSACQSFVTDGTTEVNPDAGAEDDTKTTGETEVKEGQGEESKESTGEEKLVNGTDAVQQQPEPVKHHPPQDNFYFHDPHQNARIVHALNEFRPSSAFVDVVLKSAHEVLPCHRALLAACSEHFFSWFTQKTKTDQVPIPEIKPIMLRKLVDYMYTSKFSVTEKELFRLFDGARKMQVKDAWQACLGVMAKHLSPMTCLRILKAAESAGHTELAGRARAFALENFITACQYDYFPHISKDRLVELASSDELCIPKEEMVYEAIMSWVRYDAENRKGTLPDVLAHVRFSQISESFISETILSNDIIRENAELKEKIEEWKKAESAPRKYKGSVCPQE